MSEQAILRELAAVRQLQNVLLAVVLTSLAIKIVLFLVTRAYLKRAQDLLFAVKGWANLAREQRDDAKELNRLTGEMDSERVPTAAKIEEVKQKVEDVKQAVQSGTEQVLTCITGNSPSGTMPRPNLPPEAAT